MSYDNENPQERYDNKEEKDGQETFYIRVSNRGTSGQSL